MPPCKHVRNNLNGLMYQLAGKKRADTCKGESEAGMAEKEGLVLEALRAAHTEGPLSELVKASAQALDHYLVSGHAHELLHLTATQMLGRQQQRQHQLLNLTATQMLG